MGWPGKRNIQIIRKGNHAMKRFFILLVSVLFLSAIYSADKFDALLGDLREADTASSLPATSVLDAVGKALTENSEWANIGAIASYSGNLPSGTSKCKVLVRNVTGSGGIDPYTKLMMHFNDSVTDVSSSSHSFTTANTSYVSGKFGNAISFNGSTTSYAYTASSADFNFGTGDFTISCWMKPEDNSDGSGTVEHFLNRISDAGDGKGYVLLTKSGKTIKFSDGTNTVETSGSVWDYDTQFHLAVIRTSGTVKIYVNGIEKGSGSAGANMDSTEQLNIGGIRYTGAWAHDFYKGYIDELKIDKGVARTIASLYNVTAEFYVTSTLTLTPPSGKQIKKWTTGANHSIVLSELGQTVELDRDSNGDWWPRLLIGSTPTEQAD